jgi:hypothetical protein
LFDYRVDRRQIEEEAGRPAVSQAMDDPDQSFQVYSLGQTVVVKASQLYIVAKVRGDGQVRVSVDPSHLRSFRVPVSLGVLDDANRIHPNVPKFKFSADTEGILDCLGHVSVLDQADLPIKIRFRGDI